MYNGIGGNAHCVFQFHKMDSALEYIERTFVLRPEQAGNSSGHTGALIAVILLDIN